MLSGTRSFGEVCQPAPSNTSTACTPAVTRRLISVRVRFHRLEVHLWHHDRSADAAVRADRAEDVGRRVASIARCTRTRTPAGPNTGQGALLAHAGFVAEPDLDRRAVGVGADRVLYQISKAPLKAAWAAMSYGLAPPRLQQPAIDAPPPGQLGHVDPGLEALGDRRRLLVGGPLTAPRRPGDQLDPPIYHHLRACADAWQYQSHYPFTHPRSSDRAASIIPRRAARWVTRIGYPASPAATCTAGQCQFRVAGPLRRSPRLEEVSPGQSVVSLPAATACAVLAVHAAQCAP